jgi:phosphate transport system substrate-binding protein
MSMSFSKAAKAAVLAIGISLTLTACDPPIPASLLVAQAELKVQCEQGDVTLSTSEEAADIGYSWSDALTYGCDEMTLTLVDEFSEDANLIIAEESLLAGRCEAFGVVPIAIDAAVIVFNIPGIFEIYLSPDQIAKIFSGEISNWSDQALAENNEGYEFPDLPIILPTQATVSAKNAMAEWISRIASEPLEIDQIADASGVSEIELALPAEEGSIAIASYSAATYMGAAIAAIVPISGDLESIIFADNSSITSASTQMVSTTNGSGIAVEFDPNIEPSVQQGTFEIVAPYQAVYPVNLALCGTDSALVRTAARYLLRQDSQGTIASATMLPLPEAVRIAAIEVVIVGLPTPAPVESEEDQ